MLDGSNSEEVKERLDLIDQQETIYSKLMRAFPGYFGQIFFISYKPFLEDKLDEDKLKYYEQYIDFLDSMPDFELAEDEEIAIEKVSRDISKLDMETINKQKFEAIYNVEEWLEENKDMLKRYKLFKESDMYINNTIYLIQERIKKHMEDSGYYEKAITLMRKFSSTYDEYYKQLIEANQKLIDKNI